MIDLALSALIERLAYYGACLGLIIAVPVVLYGIACRIGSRA